jgi:hypothetical protein
MKIQKCFYSSCLTLTDTLLFQKVKRCCVELTVRGTFLKLEIKPLKNPERHLLNLKCQLVANQSA